MASVASWDCTSHTMQCLGRRDAITEAPGWVARIKRSRRAPLLVAFTLHRLLCLQYIVLISCMIYCEAICDYLLYHKSTKYEGKREGYEGTSRVASCPARERCGGKSAGKVREFETSPHFSPTFASGGKVGERRGKNQLSRAFAWRQNLV